MRVPTTTTTAHITTKLTWCRSKLLVIPILLNDHDDNKENNEENTTHIPKSNVSEREPNILEGRSHMVRTNNSSLDLVPTLDGSGREPETKPVDGIMALLKNSFTSEHVEKDG